MEKIIAILLIVNSTEKYFVNLSFFHIFYVWLIYMPKLTQFQILFS